MCAQALDKIQFERLTNKNILNNELNIRLILNKANKTLSIIDNGIGMTKVGRYVGGNVPFSFALHDHQL